MLDAVQIDLAEREQARRSDAALVAYEAKWRRRLQRLQRRFPERWSVPGLSLEEVRDILCLRLLEGLRGEDSQLLELSVPGREWGLLVLRQALRALRKSFRLPITPSSALAELSSYRDTPDQEQACLEAEAEQQLLRAQRSAEAQLSRPQRQWLAALKLSARAGGMFAASDEPNLSAASRVLGKNRSSAQRAYHALQERFTNELKRFK
jgi:hypothetical protein